ncbi:MAG: MOSC domain-containing protein [Siculibacillus sp.]|nr:MOSC domain-containing protein [Siculibacillus sp.]
MSAVVTALHRYPVKGFSPDTLAAVDLVAGETMPFDRAFAIENGPSGFDPATPRHLPKMLFFCLMKNPALAEVVTRFEAETQRFTVAERDGRVVFDDTLAGEAGRAALAAFVARRFPDEVRGTPRTLAASGHSFSDVSKKVLHLVNLATLAALGAKLGEPLDAIRFRPNVIVDGLPAFAELEWAAGVRVTIGGLPFEMVKRTERCAATRVDPARGVRDLDIPRFLMQTLGHTDCGVYLRCLADGTIAVGDTVTV